MVEPEAVAAMLRLKELDWGTKRIARELGFSRRQGEALSRSRCPAAVQEAGA
jgi:hypothetical protein